VDNPNTWLDQTDIVFIDPVGTGFSRAAKPDLGKKYWSIQGDVASVGEFIRMYLVRYQRWTSPLFLVGESYGTTRAAGLSGYLVDQGIAFNGIILVSSILNFQTADFARGNELPYSLYLPTYTATAWYHKKLPPEMQQLPLREALAQSEAFAAIGYPQLLAKGDRSQPEERTTRSTCSIATRASRSTTSIRKPAREHRTVLQGADARRASFFLPDSRFTASTTRRSGVPDNDPSMSAITRRTPDVQWAHVRSELGRKTDAEYYILGGGMGGGLGRRPRGLPDVSGAARRVLKERRHAAVRRVHHDLATPYYAAQYTSTTSCRSRRNARVTTKQYEAGHMMYTTGRRREVEGRRACSTGPACRTESATGRAARATRAAGVDPSRRPLWRRRSTRGRDSAATW
jgi:carboxypeptidase C (cathepsin A)